MKTKATNKKQYFNPAPILIKKPLCLGLALISMGVASSQSYAQEKQGLMLEEVQVTATRREAGLQEVPASIAAVSASELERQGITNFADVSDAISGLTLDFPTNAINAAVYMRGVGTTGASQVQSVSTMIDGVYQVRTGVAFTELMDIERVEVLRGPQGTLFGKNSTSGAIRIFTADPDTSEFSGHVQGVVGSLNAREQRITLNVPIIEGKLAARFSGYNSHRDGYTENIFLGIDTRDIDREGWRAKVLWDATDNFQVKFTAEKHDQDATIDSGIVEYSDVALSNAANLGVTLPEVSLGKYQDDQVSRSDENVERYILNFSWDFLNHTLSTLHSREDNITYLRADRDETIAPGQLVAVHPTFGPITAAVTENTGPLDVETHEIQLSSNFDGPFSYLLGYYSQSESTKSITSIPPIFEGTTNIDIDSVGIFGNVSYDITEQWSVSLGLRRDSDERTGSNSVVGTGHIEEFEETTYSAKVTYAHDEDRMFYFSHDKGFKSGGVQRDFAGCGRGGNCITPDLALWDPEIAYNYELGMKSEWMDNRLRLNGAIFFTTFEDFQVLQNVPAEVSVLVTNAAEVEAKGIEMDFSALLSEALTLNGSATFVQSEYADYKVAPCAVPTQAGCVGGIQDLSGETLDHAPELSFNLGLDYRRALSAFDGLEVFSRLDVVYKDDQNLYVLLPEETEEDAYAVWNARLGVESEGKWKVTLWGKNITDEDYRSSADLAGAGGVAAVPGLEATFGLTADLYF